MKESGTSLTSFPQSGNNSVTRISYKKQSQVFINNNQYFEAVPPEVWEFYVGGYHVCHKWLKDRKGHELTDEDLDHYQKIVAALAETIRIMEDFSSSSRTFGRSFCGSEFFKSEE
jgi:hypothetical protein